MSSYRKTGVIVFGSNSTLGKAIKLYTHRKKEMLKALRPAKLSTMRKRIKEVWRKCATHIAVWYGDMHGSVFYYEALEGKGWQGPFPIEKARKWAAEEEGRWIERYDLTPLLAISQNEISRRVEWCEYAKQFLKYSVPQFVVFSKTVGGIARKAIPSSFFDVICSEMGSRLLCSTLFNFAWVLGKTKKHDHIAPEDIHQACILLGLVDLDAEETPMTDHWGSA